MSKGHKGSMKLH